MDAPNPYRPGAGTAPPALVGRDEELEEFRALRTVLESGQAERSMVMTGLRGVGKTVLMNEMAGEAARGPWLTTWIEARRELDLREVLARRAATMIDALNKERRASGAVRRLKEWLPTLRGRITSQGELEVELEARRAERDTHLEDDVVELLGRLGDAAREADHGVAVFIDELQELGQLEMEALCAAMQEAGRTAAPAALVGAGLPSLPGQLAEAKSYAERLFSYPEIGPLDDRDAREAIVRPAEEIALPDGGRVSFDEDALTRMIEFADGYPLSLQTIAKQTWRVATGPGVSVDDVERAEPAARAELARTIFRSRWQRATRRQREYLAAIARVGSPGQTGKVAVEAGYRDASAAARIRDELIGRGLIYAPGHGEVAFTISQFDRFVLEQAERSLEGGLGDR